MTVSQDTTLVRESARTDQSTSHSLTLPELAKLSLANRVSVRLGVWLIRRTERVRRRQERTIALERRLDHARAHREREVERFHQLGGWR